MNLKKMAEVLDKTVLDALVESSKGNQYGDALNFFTKGVLPDGSKWGEKISPVLGFDNAPKITKEKKKEKGDKMVYSARLRFAPGRGGGGGAGISATSSNHLFNMMGTDKKTVLNVSKAFDTYIKKHRGKLGGELSRWLKVPGHFVHNIVGWRNRKNWSVEDVSFKGIRYEHPMVDPTRRLWPAGRTEIWQPMTADVVITLTRKGSTK